MPLAALNCAPLCSKQSALVFLLGTYVTLVCSVAPSVTAFHIGVFVFCFVMLSVALKIVQVATGC
jgi:hypothetical protein